MKPKAWFLLIGVVLLVVGSIWIWKVHAGASQDVLSIYAAEVREKQISKELENSGTVEMENVYHITARVSAPVSKVAVQVGQEVKAGQLLAQLDVDDYHFEVERYQALVNEALANLEVAGSGAGVLETAVMEEAGPQRVTALEQSRRDLERLETLLAAGAVTVQEVEKKRLEAAQLKASAQALEAKLQESRTGLAKAKQQVAYGRVTSPVAGYVLTKEVQPGQTVSQGMPMFTLGKNSDLVVKAEIPESRLWAIEVGKEVQITSDALRGREYRGVVKRIAPVANEDLLSNEEATYDVTIMLPNVVWQEVRPGMNVKVRFTASSPRALTIPADALVEREGQAGTPLVWVVENGKAQSREVRLGLQTEQAVEVVHGLRTGEKVVLSPPVDLKEGSPVQMQGAK
ncbi:MAG: efflux RND transporter periplasmic adaptor subunit [Bacillota bacterium]|nr:efflux RND transporter periplasmic adaptor subunit [Bacillota bacterium]